MTLVLATVRNDVANYVNALFGVYTLIIIAYIVSSLFFGFGGRMPYSRWSNAILSFLRDVSEPFLRPFRAVIPQIGMFDLSPIVALFVLAGLNRIIVALIAG